MGLTFTPPNFERPGFKQHCIFRFLSFYFQEKGSPSRLSKSSFFRRWTTLVRSGYLSAIAQTPAAAAATANMGNGNGCSDAIAAAKAADYLQYNSAKEAATGFQAAKEQLFSAFKKAELGSWVKKPMEQDEFVLED
jgi:hypothetical protein